MLTFLLSIDQSYNKLKESRPYGTRYNKGPKKIPLFLYFPNELFAAMTILCDENLHCSSLKEKGIKIFRMLVLIHRLKP